MWKVIDSTDKKNLGSILELPKVTDQITLGDFVLQVADVVMIGEDYAIVGSANYILNLKKLED